MHCAQSPVYKRPILRQQHALAVLPSATASRPVKNLLSGLMTEPIPSVLEKGGKAEESNRSSGEYNDLENVPKEDDTTLVDWDGPDDPANPFNWSTPKKARQLVFMAFNTFVR